MTGQNKEIEMATAKRKTEAVVAKEEVSQPSTEKAKTTRRNRGAFNGTRGKLQVGKDIPGYHLYFFNDEPGRVQAALDAGWEFVSPEEVGYASTNVTNRNVDLGDRVSVVGGKNDQGMPQQQILLKIRQDWWEEDQIEIQRRNDKTDAAIRKGKGGSGVDTTGFYDAGIKY
jgi:hypothetical protein